MSISYSQVFVDTCINAVPCTPLIKEYQYLWQLLPYRWANELVIGEQAAATIAERYVDVGVSTEGLRERFTTPTKRGMARRLTTNIVNLQNIFSKFKKKGGLNSLACLINLGAKNTAPSYETRGLPWLRPAIVYIPARQEAVEETPSKVQSPRAEDSSIYHRNSIAKQIAHLRRFDPLIRLAFQTVWVGVNLATWKYGITKTEGSPIATRALEILAGSFLVQLPCVITHTLMLRHQDKMAKQQADVSLKDWGGTSKALFRD